MQLSELDQEKRLETLRAMEAILLKESPYIELFWAKRNYIVSDQLTTEAGAFVPAETIQTALKWEHVWLRS